eukprot:5823188-Ditylum_brightwellii.AAC.1
MAPHLPFTAQPQRKPSALVYSVISSVFMKCSYGCYTMLSQRSNIVFDHWMDIKKDSLHFIMENFSSSYFSNYYISERLPGSICLSALQMTPVFFDLINSVENVIEYVNVNGVGLLLGGISKE